MPANGPDFSRAYPEPLADALPPLVLDRQRIVQSAAFRRLQQKTQVFLAIENDHFRTRMTHTLEVAHLARCLAAQLGLNAELAEVVALAHDLGHPPFGHSGEQALRTCLAGCGGFEHNQHTLRIVEQLEHPYPAFPGLNLTLATRECLAKHETQYDRPGAHPLQDGQPPPAESGLVDLADRMACGLHDLQDGLYAGLFKPPQLKTLSLWNLAGNAPPPETPPELRAHIRPALDRILTAVIADVRRNYAARAPLGRAESGGIGRAESGSVGRAESGAVGRPELGRYRVRLSPNVEVRFAELERFLFQNVYRSERVRAADLRAQQVVAELFAAFVAAPELMPARYTARVGEQGLQRVAADYLAGMTDRYCLEVHGKIVSRSIAPAEGTATSF